MLAHNYGNACISSGPAGCSHDAVVAFVRADRPRNAVVHRGPWRGPSCGDRAEDVCFVLLQLAPKGSHLLMNKDASPAELFLSPVFPH